MKHLIKMPSIGQYNQTVKDLVHHARYKGQDENDEPIYDRNVVLPKVTFTGTVKLHGTNASVCYNNKELWAQSKGNIITPEKDNAGFANFVDKHKAYFTEKLKAMCEEFNLQEVTVYGEWAGKGIQKCVGISEIEKSFFPFGVKFLVHGEDAARWAQKPKVVLNDLENVDKNIYSILNFKTFEIEIDFDKPKDSQNKLIELTDEVENRCPVADSFITNKENTLIGEGIVWEGWYKEKRFMFKIKGKKHANSKVKTLSPVDEAKENAKREFANYACPAWRLEQMYQETFDTLNGGQGDIAGTGDFLRAVIGDVMKEEKYKLHKMNLEPKEVNGAISKIARTWFMEKLDEEIMNGN